jgi:hypothetical protein
MPPVSDFTVSAASPAYCDNASQHDQAVLFPDVPSVIGISSNPAFSNDHPTCRAAAIGNCGGLIR